MLIEKAAANLEVLLSRDGSGTFLLPASLFA